VTEVIALAFLVAGSFFAFPWTRRRYIHYSFALVANAAYFAIGPRASLLVVAGGATGALVQVARLRRVERLRQPEAYGRICSLLSATVASAAAMWITHTACTFFGVHGYPLSFGRPGDLRRFAFSLALLYGGFTSIKEGLLLLFLPPRARSGEEPQAAMETSTSLYALGGIIGFPMQFAAYAVYAREDLVAWTLVLAWGWLVNVVIGREVARMRHVGSLARELASKERLAAIGEVTARIVHQTRHQLGIIGIIVHRIERRIAALPEADAAVVRGELDKLGEVQDELRAMLSRDLRGDAAPSRPPVHATYASLVRSVAGRLEGLATARGVRVEVRELAPAESSTPRDAENVAQALFNVLENAIVAAERLVWIETAARGADLVVSIVDDGPGMTPSVAARAMEPFVTTKADGTGMGLAIARAAVDEEGGELRVENGSGGGLSVDFVFPRSPGAVQIVT
jgi:signal transduction histidine kinase